MNEVVASPFAEDSTALMSDEEFDREFAEAAAGRGELFEDVPLEEFKHGDATDGWGANP